MSLVAILGAGEIGGAAARALATRGRVPLVRLIDEHADVAAGKALDLRQSGPISGSDTGVEGVSDCAAAAGAAVIVVADPIAMGAEWSGEPGLALLRRLGKLGCFEQSVWVFAGSAQRTLMQQAFDELGLPRRRALGSAPEALAATARALVAVEAKAAASQVSLTIIGRPPDRFVVPWTEASIGGHSAASLLGPSQIHLLEGRISAMWPPGPGALGAAAALFSEAVVTGSRRFLSAFVSLDRDNGTKAPVAAWPVAVGPTGLERVTSPALMGRDRVVIDEVLE